MQSNNIDLTSNTNPELVWGLESTLGVPAATNSIWDLEQAGCILSFNNNCTEEQNVLAVPIKRAARKDAKLVVIDSREVELTRYAHVWLRPAPGTELLLLGGILRSVLDQGLEREGWLAENCESPATLHYALGSLDMDEVSATTGVSAGDIAEAARLYAGADAGAVVYGLDNIPDNHERDCVFALVDLALLTGNLGKAGAGLYPMRQGANEQGGWDVGCLPNRLPGYGWVSEEADRQAIESLWGNPAPTEPGLDLAQSVEAARGGRLKAAIVIGDSPNFTNGRLGNAIEALAGLDFLMVHDTFLTALAQRADVVLPRTTFVEKDGTYTNLERRVQRLKPVLRPAQGRDDGGRGEDRMLTELAQRIEPGTLPPMEPAQLFDELTKAAQIYGGISHGRLEREGSLVLRTQLDSPQPTQVLYASRQHNGLQWPCPPASEQGREHPGTATLYLGGFGERKAEPMTPAFNLPPHFSGAWEGMTEFPLWFAPGRVLLQQHRDMEIVKGKRNRIMREEWVEINPADAVETGLLEGDKVTLFFPLPTGEGQGEGVLPGVARFNLSLPRGVVGCTGLFGQLAIEMEASQQPNPAALLPGLEVRPARLVKAER